MVQEVFFFTEMAYSAYPQDVAAQRGYTALMLPNAYFDPAQGPRAVPMVFRGVPVRQRDRLRRRHDQRAPQQSAQYDALHQRHRGHPGQNDPTRPHHPARQRAADPRQSPGLAEEIAMLDVISGGRLTSGFVRGIGVESLDHNANPVYNRERFEEAHDLIVRTRTNLDHSAGRASITTIASSIPGCYRCKSRIRQFGCRGLPVRRPSCGRLGIATPISP